MKKFKKILIITIVLMFIVILSFIIWVSIHSTESERKKETVRIVKEVFHLDMETWDFEYEWKNTLSRYKYEGKILVEFIVSKEYAEELLFDYQDYWIENYQIYELKMIGSRVELPYEEVEKGKSVIAGHGVERTFPLLGKYVGKPRSRHHCIHVQRVDDEKVKIFLCYFEGESE